MKLYHHPVSNNCRRVLTAAALLGTKLQYLTDKQGERELYPRAAAKRADINRWQFWATAHRSGLCLGRRIDARRCQSGRNAVLRRCRTAGFIELPAGQSLARPSEGADRVQGPSRRIGISPHTGAATTSGSTRLRASSKRTGRGSDSTCNCGLAVASASSACDAHNSSSFSVLRIHARRSDPGSVS